MLLQSCGRLALSAEHSRRVLIFAKTAITLIYIVSGCFPQRMRALFSINVLVTFEHATYTCHILSCLFYYSLRGWDQVPVLMSCTSDNSVVIKQVASTAQHHCFLKIEVTLTINNSRAHSLGRISNKIRTTHAYSRCSLSSTCYSRLPIRCH